MIKIFIIFSGIDRESIKHEKITYSLRYENIFHIFKKGHRILRYNFIPNYNNISDFCNFENIRKNHKGRTFKIRI